MEIFISFLIIISLFGTIYPVQDIPGNEASVYMSGMNTIIRYNHALTPITEIKEANLVKQQYDYSCGSAALATLLQFYLGEEVGEDEVINGLLVYGDQQLIEERRAFSLLDMKRFVTVLGYNGVGYKAEIDDLIKLGMPAIIPIDVFEYVHFVVFKGVYEDHIFFADPSRGNISFTLSEFDQIWHENIAFVVYPEDETMVSDALELTKEDLRYISLDMTRKNSDTLRLPPNFLEEQKLLEATGKYKYYRNK
ncbi:MAG: C39 family peptidase [Deltaproteobacteria bacterium]|nr:C39 family peptidase [Deltaproteobacteria bacterium]